MQDQDISRRDIEITAVVIVILLAALVGWLIYRHHRTTTIVTTSNPAYTGWATDNSSLPGLSFHYPEAWTDVNSHSECTGALLVTLTPPVQEINAANTGPQYYLEIEKYGTENANCKQDGTDLQGIPFSSITSSTQLQNGIFKKKWLTFFTGGESSYQTTKADTAVVTPSGYNGSQTRLTADTVTFHGSTYQLSIETSTTENQTEEPSNISIAAFKTTQLYKDTLKLFNSIQ